MARYYFDLTRAGKREEDREGSMLIDIKDAEKEARETVRELAAEFIRKGEKIDGDRLEVRDEHGAIVLALWFRDVLI